jgi:DNA-binding NarL/FixJ family response regulator
MAAVVPIDRTGTVKRILIADDHEVVRSGLRAIVETRADWIVCGEAVDTAETPLR